MYTFNESTPRLTSLQSRAKELIARVLARVEPSEANLRLPGAVEIYDDPDRQGKLYLLTEGVLSCVQRGETIFYYDEGDLVGLERVLLPQDDEPEPPAFQIRSDFAVMVDAYDPDEILAAVAEDPTLLRDWTRFLVIQRSLFRAMVMALTKQGSSFVPEPRRYPAGQEIICQGDDGDEVYTLLEGHADVDVDGVKVGEVLPDETFGALAALVGIPRTATVRSTKDTIVLVWPRERFNELVECRPGAVHKLVEDMGRKIAALNDRVVQLSDS